MRFASIVGAVVALLCAMPAQAGPFNCQNGCDYPIDLGPFFVDYSLPSDAITYVWTFRLEADDPNTTVSLAPPNQADHTTRYFGGGSTFTSRDFPFRYEQVITPLLTTITVWAPKSYNNCASGGPIGEICAEKFDVWGNGAYLYFNTTSDTVRLFSSITAVPEPATWAMMISGFGLAGAAMRRRANFKAAQA